RSTRIEHERLRGDSGRRLRRMVRPRADTVDPQHRHAAKGVVLLARSPGDLRPGYSRWRLDPGTHRLGTRYVGAAAGRSDRRDRDRLATRRERRAVLLARLHSDSPTGCEPRRLVRVAAGPTRP